MYFCYIKKKANMYAKKVVSLVSSGENLILPLLALLQKYCWPTPGKSTIGPSLEKNPSGAHVQEYILIYRKAEGVHGKKKFGNPCSRASFCDFRPSRVSLRYLFSVCNSLFVWCCSFHSSILHASHSGTLDFFSLLGFHLQVLKVYQQYFFERGL